MYIESFIYRVGDTLDLESKTNKIKSIKRDDYTFNAMYDLTREFTNTITTTGKTALLIAGGPAIHHSDTRTNNNLKQYNSNIPIKAQLGYGSYNLARWFKQVDISYMSINSNTCASSMYCLHEAMQLLNKDYDSVIVYASDMVEESQLLLFKQLGIDIICGDGVGILVLTKNKTENSKARFINTSWVWNLDPSPMSVSSEGYSKALRDLNQDYYDIIKPHGTSTGRNDIAEKEAINSSIKFNKEYTYKDSIGHTQGASTVIELCMLLSNEDVSTSNSILLLASGLGGFYGGASLIKI